MWVCWGEGWSGVCGVGGRVGAGFCTCVLRAESNKGAPLPQENPVLASGVLGVGYVEEPRKTPKPRAGAYVHTFGTHFLVCMCVCVYVC